MRMIWDIPGGVHPPENKKQSTQMPIATIALAEEMILPLNQHIGAPAKPIVSVGETVKCGQTIALAQGVVSAPVHASTSGTIKAIENRLIPHASGMTAPCIVIATDGKDEWIPLQNCDDYNELSHEDLVSKVREAGIAGLGGAGFPCAVKLNPREKITTLILNGTECEPYITADDMLMREHAHEVIAGALLIAKIVGDPSRIIIGVEDNKPEAVKELKKASENTQIDVVVFPTKYPSGGEKQLIQILTGKEVTSGKIPAELGIVVQNVGTAVAIWQAVRYGKPLVERITTVVGQTLKRQRNIRVRLGTPIKHILDEHSFDEDACARLIIGGPMMGFTVANSDIPVIKTTNCVLAPSYEEMPEPPSEQACIRCGHCAEACPASLLPQQLYWYAQAGDHDKLAAHHLFDCIECGACSFVCPSTIPLVQYYRAAKSEIRQHQVDKIKSDHARERFEKRKERIEKIETEKEAKRLARKKAAEESRNKKASTNTDPVSAAVTRAATKPLDHSNEKAKLERTTASLENRVSVTKAQITKAQSENDEAKIAKLSAKLKQTELTLAETQNKLKHIKTPGTKTIPDVNTTSAVHTKEENKTTEPTTTKPESTDSKREKVERTISSLKNRLDIMADQINAANAAGNSDKAAKISAKMEQSKLKLQDFKNELAALDSNSAN